MSSEFPPMVDTNLVLRRPEKMVDELLIADGKLTRNERQEINKRLTEDKDNLLESVKWDLSDFVNTDYNNLSTKIIGDKSMIYVYNYFWEESWNYSEIFGKVIDFQKEHNLTVDGIVWNQILKKIKELNSDKLKRNNEKTNETIELSPNLSEFLDVAVNQVLKKLSNKLNSKEWLSFSSEWVYNEVLAVVEWIESSIELKNIFMKDIKIIKNNFLLPKEKWIKLIKYTLSKVLPNNNEKLNISEELSSSFLILKSAVWTILDMWKHMTKEELSSKVEELKNLSFIKEIIKKIPGLENALINILTTFSNTIDKQKVLDFLDDFFNSVEWNLTNLLEWKNESEDIVKQKEKNVKINLNIIRASVTFIDNITISETLNVMINEVSNLKEIKDNKVLSGIFDLISDNFLSTEIRLLIFNKATELIKLFTFREINEESINKVINDFISILSQLKIPKEKIKDISDIISQMIWQGEKQDETKDKKSDLDIETDLNTIEVAKMLWQNRKDLFGLINQSVEIKTPSLKGWKFEVKTPTLDSIKYETHNIKIPGLGDFNIRNPNFKNTFSDFSINIEFPKLEGFHFDIKVPNVSELVSYFIGNNVLWNNIKYANNKLIERLRDAMWVNLKELINTLRWNFIDNLWDIWIKKLEDPKDQTLQKGKELIEWKDFTGIILSWLQRELNSILTNKIHSNEKQNLNKKELSKILLNSSRWIILSHKEEFIDFLEKWWLKVEWKADKYIVKLVDKLLSSYKMQSLVQKMITRILTKVSSADNVILELNDAIKRFIDTKWVWVINNELMRSDLVDAWIDTFYEVFLWDKENVNILLQIFKINISTNFEIWNDTYVNLIETLKKHIPKEKIKTILKNNPDILKWKIDLTNIKEIWMDIYNRMPDRVWFIQDVTSSWILEDIKNNSDKEIESVRIINTHETWKKENILESIPDSDIASWIRILYKTINSDKGGKLWTIIDSALNKLWLKEVIWNIKIAWQSLWENSVLFLNVIKEHDLIKIVLDNKKKLSGILWNSLTQDQKINILSKIWNDILLKLDITKLQEELSDNNLSDNEKLWIDLLDEFQKYSKENSGTIEELISEWNNLYNIINWWKVVIKEGSAEAIHIQWYWEKIFSMINWIITQLDDTYLEKNLKIPKWESKDDNNEKSVVVDAIFDSVIGNNKWFGIMNWYDIVNDNHWRLADDYFRDTSNKDNFWDTIMDFMIWVTKNSK